MFDRRDREPYRVRVRRQHRAAILQAAEHYLAVAGCHRFAVDLVASSVGLARTALYRHFPHRTALIQEALAQPGTRAVALFDEVRKRNPEASIGEHLGAYVRAAAERAVTHQADTGYLQLAFPCCLALRDCPYASQDTLRPMLEAQLLSAPNLIRFSEADASLAARLLQTMLYAAYIDGQKGGPSALDRAVQLMVQVVDRGLSPRDPQR